MSKTTDHIKDAMFAVTFIYATTGLVRLGKDLAVAAKDRLKK